MLSLAKSKYDMKNHMANERTFFKYLFTGLHLGSIGTLVLTYFSANDASKLLLVAFIWLIAFGFMFWGLAGYYRYVYCFAFFFYGQISLPSAPIFTPLHNSLCLPSLAAST
jgi:uncharacterized membrane protein YidH (DUF202 family)